MVPPVTAATPMIPPRFHLSQLVSEPTDSSSLAPLLTEFITEKATTDSIASCKISQ